MANRTLTPLGKSVEYYAVDDIRQVFSCTRFLRDAVQLVQPVIVEMNVLRTATGGNATRYEPDPLYTRMQALRDLLNMLLLHTLLFVNTDRISVDLNMSDITNRIRDIEVWSHYQLYRLGILI